MLGYKTEFIYKGILFHLLSVYTFLIIMSVDEESYIDYCVVGDVILNGIHEGFDSIPSFGSCWHN